MSKRIKIKISGKGMGTDAPTVDDLSNQLRDYFELLDMVEQTLAEDGQVAIDWRIVEATTNSPLTFTVEAFSRQFAVNVDNRAQLVVAQTTLGIKALQVRSERPPYFNDKALDKAQRLFERVTNGLDQTEILIDDESDSINLTPTVARRGAQHVREVLQPIVRPYKEIGSLEGYFQSVSQDGHGRKILQMRGRITGDEVKCIVGRDAERELAHCEIGDVWKKRRISVTGLIHFRGPNNISHIEATSIRFFRSNNELPDIDDIIDPNFTGGLRSEDFLERLRNGRLS